MTYIIDAIKHDVGACPAEAPVASGIFIPLAVLFPAFIPGTQDGPHLKYQKEGQHDRAKGQHAGSWIKNNQANTQKQQNKNPKRDVAKIHSAGYLSAVIEYPESRSN